MKNTKVISVGGSIIAPDGPDSEFLKGFIKMLESWLTENDDGELILIAGGGGPARVYQAAYRAIVPRLTTSADNQEIRSQHDAEDWIGVMATRLNAELLRACLGELAPSPVIIDPTKAPDDLPGRILVAAGWKPGFSSDNDAVLLAERYGASTVINLSNIEKVYDDDPKVNPNARPLDHICWADFRKIVGDIWEPGKNTPFDPIASKRAESLGLTVICAGGRDIENTRAILNGESFKGTIISN